MSENKFWTFFAISFSVVAIYFWKTSYPVLIGIGALTMIVCYFVSYLWGKIASSEHKWLDYIFFFFSKNQKKYIVVDKIIEYEIKNEKEASYKLECTLKSKTNAEDFCYEGRYHWDQEEDINVSVFGEKGKFIAKCFEDLKWSNVDIIPENQIIHKGDIVECGFSLENLRISRLNKHSYLSCKMIEKVKHIKLIAKVAPSLKPAKKAVYIVQDALGNEISRTDLQYNEEQKAYKKNIIYPRKGRKYIIKWDYEK